MYIFKLIPKIVKYKVKDVVLAYFNVNYLKFVSLPFWIKRSKYDSDLNPSPFIKENQQDAFNSQKLSTVHF